MFRERCPECGHLLSKNRSVCPFCDWDENSDPYSYFLKIENDLAYHYPNKFRIDQLSGLFAKY